ncbi:MAG: hypothetical protein HC877_00165 [Thioploca sp.]|nr:hypothetical protein [Thioploca sp.]
MKKTSLLLAIGALLYGASGSYALADIYPGMSDDEINAVLKEHGISLEQPDSITGSGEEENAITPSDVDQALALPSYVSVDDSNPVHTTGACDPPPPSSYSVTGWDMATYMGPFPVTANTAPPSPPTTWTPGINPTGKAVSDGWMLVETGDTWNKYWTIITDPGVTVFSIEIDAWHNTNGSGKHAVFDIIHGSIVTPGSADGYPFTKKQPPNWPADTQVVYSTPVLGGVPSGDLYGVMTINFPSGFSGAATAPIGGQLMFRADTDCMPVNQGEVLSYNPDTGDLAMNIIADKDGLAAIMQKCGDDVNMVAGPFDLTGYNDNTVTTSLQLKPDCCYSLEDLDSSRNVPISGIGVITNANNELCPG